MSLKKLSNDLDRSKFRQQVQSFVCVPPWRRVTFKFWEMLKNASGVTLVPKRKKKIPKNFELCAKFRGVHSEPCWRYLVPIYQSRVQWCSCLIPESRGWRGWRSRKSRPRSTSSRPTRRRSGTGRPSPWTLKYRTPRPASRSATWRSSSPSSTTATTTSSNGSVTSGAAGSTRLGAKQKNQHDGEKLKPRLT